MTNLEPAMCQRCKTRPRAGYQHLRCGAKSWGPIWVCWECWPRAIPFIVDEANRGDGVPEEVEDDDTRPL